MLGKASKLTFVMFAQETIQRCSALLQMGANDEASPAHAQLERHMQLLVKVCGKPSLKPMVRFQEQYLALMAGSSCPAGIRQKPPAIRARTVCSIERSHIPVSCFCTHPLECRANALAQRNTVSGEKLQRAKLMSPVVLQQLALTQPLTLSQPPLQS
jgi:hypothetical protein